MKRVGIVTIYNEINYGNRLQNYAVNEVLKQLGFTPVNIIRKRDYKASKTIALKSWLYDLTYNRLRTHKRMRKFRRFTQNYMPNALILDSQKDLKLEYVVCGSDQIWNPTWAGDPFYFATFIAEKKRIAYAASFGISSVPKENTDEYSRYLSDFKAISVREDAGAEIVRELCARSADVLVDPTMMLDCVEWEKLSVKPRFYRNEKYILTYFLGTITEEMRQYIQSISDEYSLKVINLEKKNENDFWYDVGPAEFLWLIQHCELMLTDSFHGSVFSILMGVPFIVWDKIENELSSSSRIDTLLRTLNLQERKFCHQSGKSIFDNNYIHVQPILDKERARAKEFLRSAMDVSQPRMG